MREAGETTKKADI